MKTIQEDKVATGKSFVARLPGTGRNHLAQGFLGKILLLACSIGVSLSAGEFLLRRYYPIGATIAQLDQRYLYRYKPGSRELYRFSAANGGGKVLVTINGEGRRGDPVSMKRPRILVYGDSFISAVFCPVKQTFVWQLERELRTRVSPALQVVNCGVSGYGPDQESRVLEDDIDRLKPRLAIVAIYAGNDYGDLMRHKIYKLDDQRQLKENNYTLDPSLASLPLFTGEGPPLYTLRLLQRVWEKLEPAWKHDRTPRPALRGYDYPELWLRKCRAEYEEYIIHGDNVVRNLVDGHYDADISLAPNSESAQYKRILMNQVIERLKRIAAEHSVPLMLVIIPSPVDVVDNCGISIDRHKYPAYRRSQLTDVIEEIAREQNLPYVNLFNPFREHGASSLYYVVDNDHWRPEGQQLAASLVAGYITQMGLMNARDGAPSGAH
jgi:hypothetical protein